ncbi:MULTISPECIES: LysR family transcriptional regulator [Mycolicibacterium]|uniref:HTH-type transcriptional regulator GltC n=1 Tax=Mycolicibacterium mageritense TaxID=53462 RepID=A0AAI8U2K9_MYCME|nr:LysR family transcriptional regulator [Mycolicibacterium mageritense]TXI65501.1 MAG: LysR family transcriptional regulator [Mycolicibacterium mageritense]BDY33022.1 HTH-type transcriptional regulator GltC [Mycolicibacterium mageritense]
MLDVRRLRFLVELSQRGTIAAVAEALHMSPSGISQQLALLEREAGAALLERVGRGVRLTEAGQRLADRAADILAALELAHAELRSGEDPPTGTCRVAAFGSAARALVPALLGCQKLHQGLRVELVESEPEVAVPALLSGEFDLVVSEEYPAAAPSLPRHVHREVLAEDALEIVAASDLLRGRDVVKAGSSLPWALEPVGAASRAWSVQHCLGLGFTPTVQYESYDLDLLLLLVHQGAAASILPRLVLPPHRETATLVRVETGWSRTLVALTRQARAGDPSVRAVRRSLHGRFRESAVPLTDELQ